MIIKVEYTFEGEVRSRCFSVSQLGELQSAECTPISTFESHGLGDAVAASIQAVGGPAPCGGCAKRKAALNAATPGWLRRTITACLGWLERRRGKRRS